MNPSFLLLSMTIIMVVLVGAIMLKKDPMDAEKRDGNSDPVQGRDEENR